MFARHANHNPILQCFKKFMITGITLTKKTKEKLHQSLARYRNTYNTTIKLGNWKFNNVSIPSSTPCRRNVIWNRNCTSHLNQQYYKYPFWKTDILDQTSPSSPIIQRSHAANLPCWSALWWNKGIDKQPTALLWIPYSYRAMKQLHPKLLWILYSYRAKLGTLRTQLHPKLLDTRGSTCIERHWTQLCLEVVFLDFFIPILYESQFEQW